MQRSPGSTTAPTRSDQAIAGYRVLRKLGEGSRAEVFLASAEEAFPIAIKLYRRDVPDADIGTELEALTRLDSEHVVRLFDVGRAPDGRPCLLLERCPHGTLTDRLTNGRRIAAGEAVTILAPLAETVAALHAVGVAHGALTASHVMFTRRGAPVLVGWGSSQLFSAAAPPVIVDGQPGVRADRAGLLALTRAVLGVTEPRSSRLLDWLDQQPDAVDLPSLLADQLFALAEPVAIQLGETPSTLVTPVPLTPMSLTGMQRRPQVPAPPEAGPTERPVPPWLAALALPGFLAHQLTEWSERISHVLARLRAVRRRFWVAAGIPSALMITLVAVLPTGDPRATGTPDAAIPTVPATSTAPPEVMGEDPLAAAPVLVDARNRCVQELSLLCLDAVLQLGSPAYAADEAMIRAARDGGGPAVAEPLGHGQLTLVEQVGASALVHLGTDSKPASLLMIRGEAGWRIRAYLDQVAESGQ
ncbi:protein kinase [Diaminobutyricimonas sp. LJ205]|uniref:protein kinase domain-containing protein n=1 Tax=Diaminobutyricimonas sp. LJ205 TaxID=2683590 RepID=UPI0018E05E30|nr:protein kinase [Diaminobutyricimonas sp. LJ205]